MKMPFNEQSWEANSIRDIFGWRHSSWVSFETVTDFDLVNSCPAPEPAHMRKPPRQWGPYLLSDLPPFPLRCLFSFFLPVLFCSLFGGNSRRIVTSIQRSRNWNSRHNDQRICNVVRKLIGLYPQYVWDFPEEIPENFQKDPGNALRAFPGIPLESTAGIPQTLSFKAFEASRALPELSLPPVRLGTPLFSEVVPERPSQGCCPFGIPSSTEGVAQ